MSSLDDRSAELVRSLRAIIQEQEEEIRQLKAAFVPPQAVPPSWGLLPGASRVLSALMRRAPHFVTADALALAATMDVRRVLVGNNLAKVHVCALRRVLEEHVPEAQIEVAKTVGYRISVEHVAAIRTAIERDLPLPRVPRGYVSKARLAGPPGDRYSAPPPRRKAGSPQMQSAAS